MSDMITPQTISGFVKIDNVKIFFETGGEGIPLVMIHAGVADSRQWNNEFEHFAQSCQRNPIECIRVKH